MATRPGIPEFAEERSAAAHCIASPGRVRRLLAGDPAELFGGLTLSLTEDRGAKGWRWQVRAPFDGTAELFLQPVGDGCTVHAFLRARRGADSHRLDRVMAEVRQSLWRAKDRIEVGRGAGEPAIGDP